MRYPVEKVKEAILHTDQDVREAAVYYFASSFSSDPSIMPLVIQVIEKYGFEAAFQITTFLEDLVQTDETVCWLIRQLKTLGQASSAKQADSVLAYISALVHADPAILNNHKSEILQLEALTDESREAISERIDFQFHSSQELWQELEDFSQAHEGEDTILDEEFDHACRVVEALGRHRDRYADKVLKIISGRTNEIGSWMEYFAIRLAGEMKLEEAIPLMMSTLQEIPNERISEECHRAFTKMNSDAVIDQFVKHYTSSEWFQRVSIACTLEDLPSDRAVQTCLDFLKTEDDQVVRGILLQSTLFNFATEGIEPARQFILKTPIEPHVLEVRSTLLTACKLMNERFPEFDAWLEDSKKDSEFRRKWYEEHPLAEDEDERDDEESFYDDDQLEEEPFQEEEEPELPSLTIVRRNEQRVGRNDPCPCGSGKKFKKCCYRKNEVETDPIHASAMSTIAQSGSKTKFPIGTVAYYGPNDRITTKIVAGVIKRDGAEPILERWMGTNIKDSLKVQQQMQAFFQAHGVKSIVATDGNIGCPHEEGDDFPEGEDCPFCPFWQGKQGSNRKE